MFKKRRYGFGLYIAGWAQLKNNLLAFLADAYIPQKSGRRSRARSSCAPKEMALLILS